MAFRFSFRLASGRNPAGFSFLTARCNRFPYRPVICALTVLAAILCPAHAFASKNVGSGSSSIPCNSYYEANVAYNYTSKTVEYCNGTVWGNLLGAGSGITLGTSVIATNPSVTGDVTSGLFSAATSTVSVATGGVAVLTISASQNVGIGTTLPTAPLSVVVAPAYANASTTYTASYLSQTIPATDYSLNPSFYGSVIKVANNNTDGNYGSSIALSIDASQSTATHDVNGLTISLPPNGNGSAAHANNFISNTLSSYASGGFINFISNSDGGHGNGGNNTFYFLNNSAAAASTGSGYAYYGVNNTFTVGNSGHIYGAYNALSVNASATGSTVYGTYNLLNGGNDSNASTLYGTYNQLTTYAGDIAYGDYITNTASSAAGTQYGVYVDLSPGSPTAYAAVFKGGNVGIGTTIPSALLQVKGISTSVNDLSLNVVNSAGTSLLIVSNGGTVYDQVNGYWQLSQNANTLKIWNGGQYAFSSTGGAGGSPDTGISRGAANKLYVGNGTAGDFSGTLIAGNVGIGTTIPSNPLHVYNGTGSGNTFVGIDLKNATGQSGVTFQNNGSNMFRLYSTNSGGTQYLSMESYTAGKGEYIDVNGNVGIGTAAPAEPLEIYSSGSGVLLQLTGSGGTCNHTPGSSSETVSCSSDMRMKSGIEDTPSASPWLSSIRVRDFTWKKTGQKRTGVVAQELQKTHPEMVTYNRVTDEWTVEQPNPWTLVKLLQEQQAEIDDLKKQLASKH